MGEKKYPHTPFDDDDKTPVTEPPFMPGPDRPTTDYEVEREIADLRAALLEVDRLRAHLHHTELLLAEMTERAGRLAEELARVRKNRSK